MYIPTPSPPPSQGPLSHLGTGPIGIGTVEAQIEKRGRERGWDQIRYRTVMMSV